MNPFIDNSDRVRFVRKRNRDASLAIDQWCHLIAAAFTRERCAPVKAPEPPIRRNRTNPEMAPHRLVAAHAAAGRPVRLGLRQDRAMLSPDGSNREGASVA
jgi:hypothetical protein